MKTSNNNFNENVNPVNNHSNARGAIWLHFAVRPTRNRRKLRFIS